jgi:hypothetical protein
VTDVPSASGARAKPFDGTRRFRSAASGLADEVSLALDEGYNEAVAVEQVGWRPVRCPTTAASSNVMNAWLGHSPHLIVGSPQTPGTNLYDTAACTRPFPSSC